jgi:hypothetical protein
MKISSLAKQAVLLRSAAEGAPPQRIAESAQAIWHAVEAALTPIIGARGVGALYRRSLNLLSADYTWLRAAYDGSLHPDRLAVLGAALSRRSAVDAARANGALLQVFYDLLANLIGGPLTMRLLRPALDNLSTTGAVQDTMQDTHQ